MPIDLSLLKNASGQQEFVDQNNASVVQTATGLFGKYANTYTDNNNNQVVGPFTTNAAQLAALNSMWSSYRNALFPELNTANSFDTSGKSTNFLDAVNKKDVMVGYMFAASMRDFFYNWLPQNKAGATPLAIAQNIQSYFTQYIQDGTASLAGKRQNFSGMWVILVLIKMMQQMQDTAPNKASTALVYAQGEQKAALQGSKVIFYQQKSANDFATQKKNQDAQKSTETYRNWRTLTGQHTSDYQTQTQTANDNYAQIQQLISSTLEQFQSMIRDIIK